MQSTAQLLGSHRRITRVALVVTASTWWEPFGDVVPHWFSRYLSAEPSASLIRCYEARYLPGLFQTAAYARAVIAQTHTDPPSVERRVELRQARQRLLLSKPDPPRIQAIISEDALTRPPVTAGQRREQLDRLVALVERPNISIAILTSAEAATVEWPIVHDCFVLRLDYARPRVHRRT